MKAHKLSILAIGLCVTGILPAQVPNTSFADRVRATFRATDLDKNGTISPREAAKAGVPARSFAKYDQNKDRRLASDEFQVYYQNLIQKSRAERAKREAKRKEAEEKRLAEAAKKKAAAAEKGGAAPAKPGNPVGGPAENKPANPSNPSNNHGARPVTTPATKPVTPAPDGAGPATPAQNQPAPVTPAPANPVSVAPSGSNPSVDPAAKSATTKPAKGAAKDPATKPDAFWLKEEQAARASVQRVLAKGQVSAKEANQLYQALKISDVSVGASIREWRAALNSARDRVTALVRSGALDAAEGRAMYNVFEERARRAVANLVPEEDQSAEEKGVGANRASKPRRGLSQKPAKVTGPNAKGSRAAQEPRGDSLEPRKPEFGSAAERKAAKERAERNSPSAAPRKTAGTLGRQGRSQGKPTAKPLDPAEEARRTREALEILTKTPQNGGVGADPKPVSGPAKDRVKPISRPAAKPVVAPKAKPSADPKVAPKATPRDPQKRPVPTPARQRPSGKTPPVEKKSAKPAQDASKPGQAKSAAGKSDAGKSDAGKSDAGKSDAGKSKATPRTNRQ